MKTKTKIKKTFAVILALFLIIPVFNIGFITAAARINYLTVQYDSSHKDFKEAYDIANPSNDPDITNLTVKGEGEITFEDCKFIKENLNVMSINFTDAKFENNKIPERAFADFYGLVSLALPLSVTEIEKDAFSKCIGLKNIGMNANLKIIGENAFYDCMSLESIALPSAVTKIGESAFSRCDSLASVIALNSDGSKYNAASNAFSGISPRCVLVTAAESKGFDKAPFSSIANKTEWIFYALPESGMVAAGIDYQLVADVTDIKNNKASYQWYRDGYEIYGMTGDTLVLKNISPEYAGRYTVAITLNNTRALFSCIIQVGGTTSERTTVESKDTSPSNRPADAPEPGRETIKFYDYIRTINLKNVSLGVFDISDIEKDWNYSEENKILKMALAVNDEWKTDGLTYICYTKKLLEIYNKYKTGTFRFGITLTGEQSYLDVPFDFINSVKNIDLEKDYQLRIITKATDGKYSVYIAVTDENAKVLYDFKDVNNLPGVYMSLPHESKDYMIRAGEGEYVYPVPSVKDGDMLKFKIQNDIIYSRQIPKPAEFTDIKNHWGENDIIKSAENLIVEGFTDGSYRPDGTLTRAEFTTMLVRTLYYNMSNDQRVFREPAKSNVYSDVKSGDWFRNNIRYADVMGLTGFITENEFKPNQKITREEMAYMIAKALNYTGIKYPVPAESPAFNYSDIDEINQNYGKYIEACTNLKLLQGSGGYFKPKDGLTRAEAATVLNRLLNLLSESI